MAATREARDQSVPPVGGDEWRRAAPDRTAFRRDALIAVLLLIGAVVSIWLYARTGIYKDHAPVWQCLLWSALTSVPLAWRRFHPIGVTIVVAAAFISAQYLAVPDALIGNITLFLAFYSIGAWSTRRTAAMLWRIGIVAAMFIWLFSSLILGPGSDSTLSTGGVFSPYLAYGLVMILTNLLYFGAAYFFGESAYRSARQRDALRARTAELSTEREHSAAQAVALERVRIARELHDVVAHHVSVMGVQAGAARRVLAADPVSASEALSSIEDSARSAVTELHLMLSALRDDRTADAPAQGNSTRGLDQLPDLVEEARAGGLTALLTTLGSPRPVPSTIQFAAYRVAQEALTNTRKHGGPSAVAQLRVRYLDAALEVEVSDSGYGTGSDASPGSSGHRTAADPLGSPPHTGLGQVGMRERVAAVGGSITLGPKPRGGYLVRARFPLTRADAGRQEAHA